MARSFNFRLVVLRLFLVCVFLGLIVLMPILLALFAPTYDPSFSINLFDDQILNMTKTDANMAIHFDLKIKNNNKAIGLHYPDQLNITFSYFSNVSMNVNLAEYKLDRFYQGNGKSKFVRDVVETSSFPTVLEGTDLIAFRVDLVGSFRYKKVGTKRHKVELGCVVVVNVSDNTKMQSGFIRLVGPFLDSEVKKRPPIDNSGLFR